ncbi:PASTA domain-containing protein [Bifidobacterium sp. SO4]|uniref:protein kinase domain-containing protein n=1 Tax=Bifidobacterium sp. SO4 TaxID=2809030 RepID=UPI001BDC81DE|nr:PASTA domain-containing protein [Bifidobacterium sp. SO4]MBT1170304.1 PASTA domain-containing protein [Bifidobacterium sp. SO4]
MSENEPVQMIEGRYRIVRNIAEGGMATVYEAVDERLGRTVAIKVMHMQLAKGPHRDQFVERFRREANSAAAIANPHVVQVYDTGEYNGLDFLVMEYVHGVNLRHEMNTQGTFSVRETLRVVAETLDGLAAAHRIGVVHRDIKPENILLNDRGHVQITDFGLAKAASQATLSSTGMLLGTAAYLAPEMIEKNQATAQGDLYSVGIMAWEMLAGKVPFDSDNPVTLVFKHVHEDVPSIATVCPGIDPAVAAFISHLTARAVDARPSDGMAAAEELRRMAAQLPLEAWQYRLHAEPADGNHTDPTAPALVGTVAEPAVPGARPSAAGSGVTSAGTSATSATPTTAMPVDAGSGTATAPASSPDVPQPAIPAPPAPPVARTTAIDPSMTQAMPQPGGETQVLSPIDDQFTQAIAMTDGAQDPDGAAKHTDGTTPARKPWWKRPPFIVTIVVLVVLSLIGSTAGWWWFAGPGSYWSVPQAEDVTCAADESQCSLTGADWSTYESTLKALGIPYETKKQYSDDVAEGKIIATSVNGSDAFVNSRISKRQNQKLTVTISRGVRMATIPTDITDANSDDGKSPLAALKKAGFTNIKHDSSKDEYSLDKPEGTLLTISPDPGTTAKHNAEVTVTLSKGPMPVSMPDIVGKTKDEMQAAFDELKLTANITEQYDDKVAAGDVISASQQAGAQLKWGDSVDVVISKGPETTVLPNVVGMKYDAAAAQLEKLGFTVKKSAPLGDITHEVRVQSPKAGETVRIRDENGTPTVITLTVV